MWLNGSTVGSTANEKENIGNKDYYKRPETRSKHTKG